MITAPVSRLLSVADLARSAAFYRDVLGFEVRPASPDPDGSAVLEAVLGPARLQLRVAESAADSTGVSRPRGAAVLFFATNRVAALHASIVSRGGQPSIIERANWIKQRVFQIRDPDGHTLWFGQSDQEPESERPPAMLEQALPELPLTDVAAGIAYYRDHLGFSINYAQDGLGVMDRDRITLLLIQRTEQHRGIGSCEFYIRDADALHAELVERGARVLDRPVSMPWGLRHFHVEDLEGNRITFAQPFE
jgi:catechol 2,3-dioxygenase-like lactoylglutathione lyase family enzyme